MNENLKDILIVGLPTLMVLVGILLNRNDSNQLRGEMATLREEFRGEMATLREELATLRGELRGEMATLRGELRAEMGKLRDQSHTDIVHLLEHDRDQDSRITRIEERTK
jgi:hypothetical protein